MSRYFSSQLAFTRILERMGSPLWKAIDIAFLFFVLIHALTGAYMVLTDMERFNKFSRVLAGLAIVLGIWAMFYGAQTILAFTPPV